MNSALLSAEQLAAVPDEPPVWRQVLTLAWPAAAQNALLAVVALFDRWLAGQTSADPAAAAGQTTATYLAWFLLSYTMLVTGGSTTLVAYLFGAGDRRSAGWVLHQSLGLAALLGLLGTAGGLLVLEPALRLLQLEGPALTYAADFLRPLLYSLPLHMLCSAGIACLAGAGDTRSGMFVLGGVALINMPLAIGFSQGWGPIAPLGVAGITVGTALSQALGGVVVFGILAHGRAGLRLDASMSRPRLDLLARLLWVSIPAAFDNLSMQAGYLWFLAIVNTLGATASAAHGHALAWEGLGYMMGAAFGTAAVTVVGQHQGAGRSDRAAAGGWASFLLGTAVMCFMGAIFFTFAEPMLRVFSPHPEQQPIVTAGVQALRLVAFGMPALASCLILASALRGAGDTRVPVLFTWAGFFAVRIPLAYLLTREPFALGLVGAWLAMVGDLYVRGLCLLLRFASGRWKRVRV